MKTILKKPNVTTIVASMLLAVVISFTTACETENTTETDYTDAEYLELDKYKFEKIKQKDIEKIAEGFKRLETIKVEGIYMIEENSPEKLNMSKKLLFFLVQGLKYSNNTLKFKSNLSKTTRLKSDNPEYWDDDQQPEDPYCFSYSIKNLGTYSFEDAKNYSDSQYGAGNGVPVGKAEEFFKHFYPNGQILSLDDFVDGDLNGTIVILTDYSNGKAHAVNGKLYVMNHVGYFDGQTDDQDWTETKYVVKIFKP
ncbi:hypothetical protein [Siansivirga zeaxanthinifaciens]|uniref:Lipoprotein n=1 Tax=Siansivirga zeaxanthinifaciens CC-SAMT-1 TaxID=1454006 RepID=A0A0C5WF52_9FLAO|nr:hypothetical protein [Siansivirga zeaxanthinifaciens]AJR04842.1 hypothetical protein AW14_06845 [Siansivirga zeaxanthinifaciens CC-SAMT-1]